MRPAAGTYPELPPDLDPVFVRLYERALPWLGTRSNDLHARVACQFVLEIIEQEQGDPRVAVPAMLLHDLGWSRIPEDLQRRAYGPNSTDAELNRLHEIEGAALARKILAGEGYDAGLIAEICRIIEGHDSSPSAQTVEEAAVKDSDKIYRVSRVGFPVSLQYMSDLTPQEFHDFIAVRAPRWFLTPTGLEVARRELDARRREYGLDEAPDIPPPAGYGIGDVKAYKS